MFNDAADLWDFYGTRVGQVARRLIRRRIRELWPSSAGETVLGLGYATPFLPLFRGEAERVFAVMPARQGVLHWPREGKGLVCLADEAELPLQDVSVDRVLLVHALECTEQLRPMLQEIWRVLAGNGKLLVVVPNRRGIWARLDRTPFGHGHPYSPTQLSRLLKDNMFAPSLTAHALYIPPSNSPLLLRSAVAVEKLGERLFNRFSGVILIEATKQIYARPKGRAVKIRQLLPLPGRPAPALNTAPVRSAYRFSVRPQCRMRDRALRTAG